MHVPSFAIFLDEKAKMKYQNVFFVAKKQKVIIRSY